MGEVVEARGGGGGLQVLREIVGGGGGGGQALGEVVGGETRRRWEMMWMGGKTCTRWERFEGHADVGRCC